MEYYKLEFHFTEPQTGFRIAFNMFDTDGNERVDKNEFLVVSNFIIFPKISASNLIVSDKNINVDD